MCRRANRLAYRRTHRHTYPHKRDRLGAELLGASIKSGKGYRRVYRHMVTHVHAHAYTNVHRQVYRSNSIKAATVSLLGLIGHNYIGHNCSRHLNKGGDSVFVRLRVRPRRYWPATSQHQADIELIHTEPIWSWHAYIRYRAGIDTGPLG